MENVGTGAGTGQQWWRCVTHRGPQAALSPSMAVHGSCFPPGIPPGDLSSSPANHTGPVQGTFGLLCFLHKARCTSGPLTSLSGRCEWSVPTCPCGLGLLAQPLSAPYDSSIRSHLHQPPIRWFLWEIPGLCLHCENKVLTRNASFPTGACRHTLRGSLFMSLSSTTLSSANSG